MDIMLNLAADGPEWWDLVPALLGAIVGSATGAVPAFILARRSAKEVLNRDTVARKEASKAAAFRLSVKLLAIVDEVGTLREYVSEKLAVGKLPDRKHMEPFQLVPAQIGTSDHDIVKFDADELAVLFEAGQSELMQKLTLLQRRATSTNVSFRAYCDRREAWREIAPTPDSFDGTLGSTTVSKKEMMRLKVHMIPMNDLITSIAERLEEDWRLANEVMGEFSKVARTILDRPNFEIISAENAETKKAAS